MSQSLNVTINIPIPEEMVLITKIEYQELKEKADEGRWWKIDDVLNHISMKRDWFDKNILKKSKWRKILDVELNPNGFVHYPKTTGPYIFEADGMKKFLKKNFREITKDL